MTNAEARVVLGVVCAVVVFAIFVVLAAIKLV